MTTRSASVMSSGSGKSRPVHTGQSAAFSSSAASSSSSSGPSVLPVSVSSGQWYASSPRARASDQRLRSHLTRNNRVREVSAHSAKVHTVGWSCDGRRLASGSLDRTVVIYTLDRDRIAKDHTFKGHGESVDQLAWHPTAPDILASASGDKTVRIWDARSQRSVASVNTRGENINVRFAPLPSSAEPHAIAVGNKDDVLTFIDARTHRVIREETFRFEVNEFAWNAAGDLFFVTAGTGSIHVFSYPEMKPLMELRANSGNCICIATDGAIGEHFAVGGADAVVSIWDARELLSVRAITRLEWPIRSVSFSHDGLLLATGSEDLLVDIASVATGKRLYALPCEAFTFALAWSPKEFLLAVAGDDKLREKSVAGEDRDAGNVRIFGFPNESSNSN